MQRLLELISKFLDWLSPKEIYPPRLSKDEYERTKTLHSKDIARLLKKTGTN
ncbi:MAG: hypothetical protein AB8G05_27500 [Oligoflexales bacterium]